MAFCGVTKSGKPVLYDNMLAYMRGYMFGLPALLAVQIIGPVIILDNGKKIFSISAVVLGVTDIALDLLNALVLHGGTFGMGVATSVSLTVQLAILVAFLLRNNGKSRFSLKAFRSKEISELVKAGSPTLVQSLAVSLRDVSINRLNLLFAVSTAAIVARGVQYDFNMVLFCISDGLSNTMVSMAGIYHSVSDKSGLQRVFKYGLNLSMRFAIATFAVVFILAPQIAGFYTSDAETAALGAYAIRCMALFMEEMAGNVVQHGNPDTQKVTGVEYRLFVNDNRICLTLRDYNRAFDPTAWYQANSDTEPDKGTGIRMVMALAEDTCYFNAFNSNNLILWLSAGKDAKSEQKQPSAVTSGE